jgi:hypothetical protein
MTEHVPRVPAARGWPDARTRFRRLSRSTHFLATGVEAHGIIGRSGCRLSACDHPPMWIYICNICLRSRPPDPSPSILDGGGLGGRSTIDCLIGKTFSGSSLNMPGVLQFGYGARRSTSDTASYLRCACGEVERGRQRLSLSML